MDYDAVAVGPLDLAAGIDFLNGEGTLPWLSANLRDNRQQPLFPSHTVVSRGGIAIGIIGLTGHQDSLPQDVAVSDWRDLLPQIVAELRGSCQLLVVLSTLSEADNRELMHSFPDIHVLLSADRQRGNIAPVVENRSLTAQTANQGRYLGILDLSWMPGATLPRSDRSAATVVLGNEDRQIVTAYSGESLPLRKNLAEDPIIAAKVKEALERIRQRQP